MAHKYLNQLGIKSNNECIFNPIKRVKFREIKGLLEHGFFTWQEVSDLDVTSAMWLYEHVKVYKDMASKIVVLDDPEHMFEIPVLSDVSVEYYKGNKQFPIVSQVENIEKHTQLEAINYIIEYLEYFLTDHIEPDEYEKESWDNTFFEKLSLIELKQWECVRCAFRIYAMIIGSMWI